MSESFLKIKAPQFEINSLIDDCEGFRIICTVQKKSIGKMRIKFNDVFSFRTMDPDLLTEEVLPSYTNGNIFKIYKSNFKKWFLQEAGQYRDFTGMDEILHYRIITDEQCIDILTCSGPIIEEL